MKKEYKEPILEYINIPNKEFILCSTEGEVDWWQDD